MAETQLIELWRSQAIVLLRNGHSVAQLQRVLADAMEKVEAETAVDEQKVCPHPKACWGEGVCLSVEGGGELCTDSRFGRAES